jgi:hypothetical protein
MFVDRPPPGGKSCATALLSARSDEIGEIALESGIRIEATWKDALFRAFFVGLVSEIVLLLEAYRTVRQFREAG